jgi:hypothetical protein
MPTIAKRLLTAVGVIGAVFATLVIFARYGPSEFRERKALLDPLLTQRASIQQVTQALAFESPIDYSRSGTNYAALMEFLSREPSTSFVPVRKGAARYPTILQYSTSSMMTWLFFDAEGRLQDYHLCAQ